MASEISLEDECAVAKHERDDALQSLAARDREIAALLEAIRQHMGQIDRLQTTIMKLKGDAPEALSGSPAPDPADDQSEYGPMVYSDQTQPTVYPSASVRAPDPAEAMRIVSTDALQSLAARDREIAALRRELAARNPRFQEYWDEIFRLRALLAETNKACAEWKRRAFNLPPHLDPAEAIRAKCEAIARAEQRRWPGMRIATNIANEIAALKGSSEGL